MRVPIERLRRNYLGHFIAEEGVKSYVSNDRKLRLSESLKVGDPV
jgi:hypothetical protein